MLVRYGIESVLGRDGDIAHLSRVVAGYRYDLDHFSRFVCSSES